jgi:hypothetical protein
LVVIYACCQVGCFKDYGYKEKNPDVRRNVMASDGRLVIHGIKRWFWPLREGLCSPGSAEAMGEEGRPPYGDVCQRSWDHECAGAVMHALLSQAYVDLMYQVVHHVE